MSVDPARKVVRTRRKRREPYQVRTVQQITYDTWRLEFDGAPMTFEPGQYVVMRVSSEGEKPEPHPFSISSSPSNPIMEMTVKEAGDFTAAIGNLKPGDDITLDGPFGKFSYSFHDAENLVFIAGGIGITPFISMLRDLAEKDFPRNVVLIWGNKHERDITFREEIEELAARFDQFQVMHVLSEQDDWEGEKGYVSAELLKQTLAFDPDTQYFVCGPPGMNDLVLAMLNDMDIPEDRVHTERFTRR